LALTTTAKHALEDALAPQRKASVILGAGAGLRQGEALGVTCDRIDVLRRQLRVDRQLMNLPRQAPELVPVTTRTSVRTIPLPQIVVDALVAHLTEFPSADLRTRCGPAGEPATESPVQRLSGPLRDRT
jgi:integrase